MRTKADTIQRTWAFWASAGVFIGGYAVGTLVQYYSWPWWSGLVVAVVAVPCIAFLMDRL
jgi:hypothetical protein